MKKIFIMLTACFCAYSYGFAAPLNENQYEERYVFVDVARIRSKPQIDSKIQDKVLLGQSVMLIEKTTENYQLNGFKEYWYKVKYKKDNRVKEGYIWGGLISQKVVKYRNGIILFGVYSFKEELGYVSGLKYISDNQLISKISFSLNCSLCPMEIPACDIEYYDNLGYPGIQNVLKVSFSAVPSFEKNNRNIVLINSGQLHLMAAEYFSGEGGVGSESEVYIFPAEQGGVIDTILYRRIKTSFNEAKNKDIIVRDETTRYIWESNTLLRSK